jgi:hypothetical protein
MQIEIIINDVFSVCALSLGGVFTPTRYPLETQSRKTQAGTKRVEIYGWAEL